MLGRGRSAMIDDFTGVSLDDRQAPLKPAGKGHRELLAAFHAALKGDPGPPTWPGTSRATLLAAGVLTQSAAPFGSADLT